MAEVGLKMDQSQSCTFSATDDRPSQTVLASGFIAEHTHCICMLISEIGPTGTPPWYSGKYSCGSRAVLLKNQFSAL